MEIAEEVLYEATKAAEIPSNLIYSVIVHLEEFRGISNDVY